MDLRAPANKKSPLEQVQEQFEHWWSPAIMSLLSININAKDYENTTPLHFACMWGHVEAVSLLIKLGAKPDVQAAGLGRTPMSLAETNGHTEIVQILKDAGAKK